VVGSPPKRGQGFWLTVGEIVGVLALVIAGLNFWDSHQEHAAEARREQAQARREQAQSQAETAFVATGDADPQGRAVILRPLKTTQAIQSQRYTFPTDVSGDAKDVTADRPHIELDWLADGLKHALEAAHAKPSGAARVPVVIETVYVEDGDTHTDRSLYQVGFAWKRGFLGAWQVRLRGIALSRRGLAGDAAAALQKPWSSAKRDFSGEFAIPPAS
jgi:hypothetical protein